MTSLIWLRDSHSVEQHLDSILSEPLIAFDLEKNNYLGYLGKIGLIQVATPQQIYFIDPTTLSHKDLLKSLQPLVSSSIRKIAHSCDQDLRDLHAQFGIRCQNVWDTQIAAAFLCEKYLGLDTLLHKIFGITFHNKSTFQKMDWSQRPLPTEVLEYAQKDVIHLFELYEHFLVQLEETPFQQAVVEESEWLASQDYPIPEFNEDGFQKIQDSQALNSRQRASLKAMYLWRHQQCSLEDKAAFLVCPDYALIHIAQFQPKNLQQLSGFLKKEEQKPYAAALWEVLKQSQSATPIAYKKYSKYSGKSVKKEDFASFKEWRDSKAAEWSLPTALVLTNQEMKTLLQHKVRNMKELTKLNCLRPWKLSLLGRELLEWLSKLS